MIWKKNNYQLQLTEADNMMNINNEEGKLIFSFPFNATIITTNDTYNLCGGSYTITDNLVKLEKEFENGEIEKMELNLMISSTDAVASLVVTPRETIRIKETVYFQENKKGLSLLRCYKNFSPAPKSLGGVNRSLYSISCDCSLASYFSPGPLNFTTGNDFGLVSFGLLDLPDSNEYRFSEYGGILAEYPCGKKIIAKNEIYNAPRLLLTFPEDEWSGIRLFRDKLIEKKAYIPKRINEEVPEWWKEPMVVTYGDQMMELQYSGSDLDYDSPGYTEEWLDMWFERARNKLQLEKFTVVVDAFWQHRYSCEPKVNPKTFKNLRKFIDKCHFLGHKVILWTAPLIDNTNNGFKTLTEKYDILTKETSPFVYPSDTTFYIDFTSDNIDEYFKELSRLFFSDDEDALNCDGLKLDYLAHFHNPKISEYKNFKNGMGVKEMYRFYEKFLYQARLVKKDVLLNGSACDPRFEEVVCMNRLHDIQLYYPEREDRARISALAAPGTIIDSDGAVMHSHWVKKTYINAVVYSTPALYYIKEFHDRVSLSDEEMTSLGKLLSLSSKKPCGEVEYVDYGNWRIVNNEKIMAESIDNNRVIMFADNSKMYLFTWEDGENVFPMYGRELKDADDKFVIKDGMLYATLKAGEVYEVEYR